MKTLLEMLRNLSDVRFPISNGRGPVRLVPASVRFTSLSSKPISGGRKPKSFISVTLRETTRKSSSHETPGKEQCAAGEEETSQSFRSAPLGPFMADLSFNRTSRSLYEEEHAEKRRKSIAM